MIDRRLQVVIVVVLFLLPVCAQDVPTAKQMFWNRQYRDVFDALFNYIGMNFEVDYMVGVSTCQLPGIASDGYDFLTLVSRNYRAPYIFDGKKVDLTYDRRRYCGPASVSMGDAASSQSAGENSQSSSVAPTLQSIAARAKAKLPSGRSTAVQSVPAPVRCIQGFVWREADSTDHVCVTPQTRDQTAADNAATDRKNADGRCIQGFVWREADSTDHVCVTPQTRAQTAADNRAAPSRTK